MPLQSAQDAARAEQRIFAGLPHGRDGYLGQFDRRLSIAITRRLVRTRVTPNQITAASIAVGLAGAVLIAGVGYTTTLVGVFLAWLSSILDGCDGEVARLKRLASEAGRRFDLFGDFLVNFSVLASIAWHVHRTRPDSNLGALGILMVSGVALSAVTAGWVFLRKPGRKPDGLERAFQRLASRDFIYVVIPLCALDRLDWFVYGAAVGSQLFWIALLVLVASRRLAAGTAAK
ncbi:MAG: CDP-alcohol phosphatidyltransferase family protein [Thermoanaerobaculia bacterium]